MEEVKELKKRLNSVENRMSSGCHYDPETFVSNIVVDGDVKEVDETLPIQYSTKFPVHQTENSPNKMMDLDMTFQNITVQH